VVAWNLISHLVLVKHALRSREWGWGCEMVWGGGQVPPTVALFLRGGFPMPEAKDAAAKESATKESAAKESAAKDAAPKDAAPKVAPDRAVALRSSPPHPERKQTKSVGPFFSEHTPWT